MARRPGATSAQLLHAVSCRPQDKRTRILSALNDAGLAPTTPAGAYYVLADSSNLPGKNGGKQDLLRLPGWPRGGAHSSAWTRRESAAILLRQEGRRLDDACARLRKL